MFKKLLNISCVQATLLACKKESYKISAKEKIQLKLHNAICTGCKRFADQTSFIGRNAKFADHYHEAVLSTQKKQAIKELLV